MRMLLLSQILLCLFVCSPTLKAQLTPDEIVRIEEWAENERRREERELDEARKRLREERVKNRPKGGKSKTNWWLWIKISLFIGVGILLGLNAQFNKS